MLLVFMGHSMQKLLALVDRLLHFLLITTLLLLIVPVSLQIFSRFTDLIPRYMWTEEMSRFFSCGSSC